MERPAKSRVRHGMASCARYGCKRPECLEAQLRARLASEEDVRNGNRFAVPVDTASLHANALVRAGMSAKDIANRSGVCETVVLEVVRREHKRIYRTTEEAILGIPIPEDGWTPITDGITDAVGTRRRLQALSFQGFPLSFLARETGLCRRRTYVLRSGKQARVFISGMLAVTEVHDRFWDTDPLSTGLRPHDVTRARQWAQRQDWLPTEVWSDIDDPDCEPVLSTPRYMALTDDAEELMTQQGYTRTLAAERLGVAVSTLNTAFWYRNQRATTDA